MYWARIYDVRDENKTGKLLWHFGFDFVLNYIYTLSKLQNHVCPLKIHNIMFALVNY
jgi:hypothetical protein